MGFVLHVVLWSLLWEEGAKASLVLFISLFNRKQFIFSFWQHARSKLLPPLVRELILHFLVFWFYLFEFSLCEASLSLFPPFSPSFSQHCSHLVQLVIVFLLFSDSRHQCCIQITHPRENWCQQRTYIFSLALKCLSFSFIPFSSQPVTSIVIT